MATTTPSPQYTSLLDAWEAAARRSEKTSSDKDSAAEQVAYDELIEYVEDNDLNYTSLDPRGEESETFPAGLVSEEPEPEQQMPTEPLTQTQARVKAAELNTATGQIHVAEQFPLGSWGGHGTHYVVTNLATGKQVA